MMLNWFYDVLCDLVLFLFVVRVVFVVVVLLFLLLFIVLCYFGFSIPGVLSW